MKTKTKPPRASVMWASMSDVTNELRCHDLQESRVPAAHTYTGFDYVHPCAVLPFRTAKQARAFVRFWNMTEEERVDAIAAASSAYATTTMGEDQAWNDTAHSLAVLAAVFGEARPCA